MNNVNYLSILSTILASFLLLLLAGCNDSRTVSEFEAELKNRDKSNDVTKLIEEPIGEAGPADLPVDEVLRRKQELSHVALEKKVELGSSRPFWGFRCLSYAVSIPVFNPVLQDWENVEATYVVPRSRHQNPNGIAGFVISPNISGTSPLEVRLAALFCQNNMAAIYPRRVVDYSVEPESYPGWNVFNQNIQRNIARMKTLADFLQQQPEVRHIGAAGGSLGGIMTSIFAGVDERVHASIIIAGGGNLAEVLTHSEVGLIRRVRDEQMKYLDEPSLENYEKKLKTTLRYDPLVFAGLVSKETVFMGIVEGDDSVSTDNQWELWNALRRPEHDSRTGPHVWGITKYVLHTNLQPAIEFVTRKFE